MNWKDSGVWFFIWCLGLAIGAVAAVVYKLVYPWACPRWWDACPIAAMVSVCGLSVSLVYAFITKNR